MTLQYNVVYNKDLSSLVQEVNSAVADGWKLRGGVAYTGEHFLQAISRELELPNVDNGPSDKGAPSDADQKAVDA